MRLCKASNPVYTCIIALILIFPNMKKTFIQNSDVISTDLSSHFQILSEQSQDDHIVQINVFGNLWEPLFRWMNADSRIFRDQPASKNRVTVGDLLSLGEIYGFLPVHWKVSKLTPFNTNLIPIQIRNICRKLPIIKYFGVNISLTLYKSCSTSTGSNKSISIVFPARNESGNEILMRKALDKIKASIPTAEIVIVEGNSTDNTYSVFSQIVSEYSDHLNIRIIQQDNRGKKNAVICGFSKCTGDVFAIIDCDFTVDIDDSISAILLALDHPCAMINCSRTIYPMQRKAMRWSNYIGNRVFALLVSFLADQSVSDSLCGTKIFTRRLYQSLLDDGSWLSKRDPFGDFTLIFGASNHSYRILNYPVRYYARLSGAPNIARWKDGVKLLKVCLFQFLN